MSISKMTKKLNCYATFFPKYCVFQDLSSGRVREIGKLEDRFYILHSQTRTKGGEGSRCLAATQHADAVTWHQRIYHVPMSVLRKLPMFFHVSRDKSFSLNNCEVCTLARQTRLPFPHSVSRSTSAFQLLYMDVCGAYKSKTFDGTK